MNGYEGNGAYCPEVQVLKDQIRTLVRFGACSPNRDARPKKMLEDCSDAGHLETMVRNDSCAEDYPPDLHPWIPVLNIVNHHV